MNPRRVLVAAAAVALAALTAPSDSYAQEKPPAQAQEQRKLSNDEKRDYLALGELVDAVSAGKQPAPADVKIKFQNHFLKSNETKACLIFSCRSGARLCATPNAVRGNGLDS